MNTKTLSTRALSVIDQYMHFKLGNAVCSVPYFNNKVDRKRAALRVNVGKGSPKEIFDDIRDIITKNRLSIDMIADDSLKKLLVDNNIGIDCSAFAYYVLNAEYEELGKGTLDKHISFVNCSGILGKIRCSLRPIENCDVATLADNKNSSFIPLKEIVPGDIITMVGGPDNSERDHILVVHQIEYQNFLPVKIHYSHSITYPEDGLYGNGIKQGVIEIINLEGTIVEQRWIENNLENVNNQLFLRGQKSKTEIRRLR